MNPLARACGHGTMCRVGRPVPMRLPGRPSVRPASRRSRSAPPAWWRRALLVGLALAASTTIAGAHSWYEAACCSGQDCAPIPVDAVGFDANGDYLVTIQAGAHPLVKSTQTWVWPRSQARVSQDGSWHGCVSLAKNAAGQQRLLCLYAPMSF